MLWSACLLAAGAISSIRAQDASMGDLYTSPEVLPVRFADGSGDWSAAYERAQDFVSQLTIQEKVNLTTGQGTESRCVGNSGAVTSQDFAGLCYHDSPTGIRMADLVSVFPSGINAASTFDRDLIRRRAQYLGAEARGKGVNVLLAPATTIARAPAAGRNWESFGGDPFLAGVASVESVEGIQSQGVIANIKHFIANEQEHFRYSASSNIDDRTLHEVYQWPFAAAVRAGVGSVMCGYNRVNQTYACDNSKLLNGLLKQELNFQGFVLTDWVAIYGEGSAAALAGTDVNMPGMISYGNTDVTQNPATEQNSLWGAALVRMVQDGTVPEDRLDDMVIRIMAAYYQMDQDDNFPDVNFNWLGPDYPGNEHVDVRGNHSELIREMGAASAILLKNNGSMLPLDASSIDSIGVFGSDGGPSPLGINPCFNAACSSGTLAVGYGSGQANFTYLVDPLQGIRNKTSDANLTVQAVLDDYDYDSARSLAASSGVCVVFGQANSGEEFEEVEGNQGDRNNLYLWHEGNQMIQTVANACENTIVVIHSTGQINMEAWVEHPNVKAIIWASLPGQESGNGLADVMFGDVNPSGRLPYTIGRRRSDYSANVIYDDQDPYLQIDFDERLLVDYRHFDANDIEPRFEFGFGLSYSTFEYSNLEVSNITDANDNANGGIGGPASLWTPTLEVSFEVENTEGPAGHEVSQVYLAFPDGAGEPPRVLRGFERTRINDGETAQVTIQLTRKDLSIWDVVSQSWVQPDGEYEIFVGSSSRQLPLRQTFRP